MNNNMTGLRSFSKSLCPCALYESSFSIGSESCLISYVCISEPSLPQLYQGIFSLSKSERDKYTADVLQLCSAPDVLEDVFLLVSGNICLFVQGATLTFAAACTIGQVRFNFQ